MTRVTVAPSVVRAGARRGTGCSVRDAVASDAPGVLALINQWADRGLTLRRTEADLTAAIHGFTVVERGGRLIACAAMEPISPRLGEVRSVAVDHAATGSGAGRLAVLGLCDRAAASGLEQLVLLTRSPAFFARLGFSEMPLSAGPPEYTDGSLARQGRQTVGRALMSRLVAADPGVHAVASSVA